MQPDQTDDKGFFPVFRRIDAWLQSAANAGKTFLVAIEGPCGSGKSTLSRRLQDVYGDDANIFYMDHFFLPEILRTPGRLSEPGGNIDYARFREEVAGGLRRGEPFQYRIYDCSIRQLADTVQVGPRPLAIIEGVYSMHPALGLPYDLRVFLSLSKAEQLRRILERSGPEMLERFVQEWIPMENRYFEAMKIPEQCNLILGEPYH